MLIKILSNHIHLWEIPLNPDNSEALIPICRKILPVDELERADRFIFEKHRRRFIFAHYGLRKILSNYLAISPERIDFQILSHGKPQLIASQNPNIIEFNLSHSGETALVGLRTEKTIGVDIEYHRDREFLGIAEHVFSDLECDSLSAINNDSDKIHAFFHIWAQKEAFIKAIGQGLSYPLKEFSVSPTAPAQLTESQHENTNNWYLHSFQPTPDAHAAIASLNPIHQISYFAFSYE